VALPSTPPQDQATKGKSKWPLILGIAGGAAAVGVIVAPRRRPRRTWHSSCGPNPFCLRLGRQPLCCR
jgi:hypothetical protein